MAIHLHTPASNPRPQDDSVRPGDFQTPEDAAVVVPAGEQGSERRRRVGWRRMAVPAVLLLGLGSGLAWVLSNNAEEEPSTMLGATDEIDGGLARINGIIPLETDGWAPVGDPAALAEPVAEGAHRVRILLELTALEAEGIDFRASDYAVEGLGAGEPRVIWSSPAEVTAEQGETIEAVLVFEIPNQAIALELSGADDLRLSMGTDHHTSAG
ncbi:hypothetical protein BJ994_001815 [Arthrobacter pigmenti]|uniref:DUF4352 domain-containing protein n=1 Tax=Arthrobacter pigmenti TaxID=271432 RepID=A0A846RNU0_9MICC|nr:hypothetical protein [Arthrobacter pigmenti]NJC22739.1 hypothetical protein [Arthrobacter pigmenti]